LEDNFSVLAGPPLNPPTRPDATAARFFSDEFLSEGFKVGSCEVCASS